MDVQCAFILGELSRIGVLGIVGGILVLAMMMGPKRRRRHACAGPPPLPYRKRRRGHGWWWIIGIVALVFFFRAKHSNQHVPWAGPWAARQAQDGSTLEPRRNAFIDAQGRQVAMLDLRLSLKKCEDHDVEPADIAAGLLTLVDRLQENLTADEGRQRGPSIDELGKNLVLAGEPNVEWAQVARLSRRQPLGARDAPLGTIRIRYEERMRSSGDSREYMKDVADEVGFVLNSRMAHGEGLFSIERDAADSFLLRAWGTPDYGYAQTVQPIEPDIQVAPAPQVNPIPIVDPAPQVDQPDRLAQVIDAALAWALSAEEREEIKRAAIEARRDAVREATKAIAEAATARVESRRSEAQSTDENPRAIAEKIRKGIMVYPEEAEEGQPAKPWSFMGAPDWVQSPPETRFDGGVYVATGATGALFSSAHESREALNEVLDSIINEYAGLVVTPQIARQLDLTYLRSRVSTWTGSTTSESTGLKVYESHAKLELGPTDHERLLRLAHNQQGQRSALLAGIAGGTVLLLLGTALSYLKLDTVTRGYYSGRLKFAAGTAVVAVVGLASVAAWITLAV